MESNYNKYSVGASPLQEVAKATSETYRTGYFFPSDDIDPKHKKGFWCLKWQEAIWSLFIRKGTYNNVDMINELRWLRMYGAGRQPKQLYQDILLDGEREGWINTNWEIFSPISKYKRIIFGRFEDQDFDYSATAIDPISSDEKETMAWNTWYDSRFGEKEAELRKILGMPEPQEGAKYFANSLEEIEMVKSMGGFKIPIEMQAEMLLEATDFVSDHKTLARKIWNDLIDFNKAAYRDVYDPVSGLCKYEYVDWENLVVDYSRETDFKDIRFWGYLTFKTINEVRAKRPDMTEEEILKCVQPWLGYFGNLNSQMLGRYQMTGYKDENGNLVYNNLRVPVFCSEWVSTDTKYKVMKNGRMYDGDYGKIKNSDKKKTLVFEGNNVYYSEWIVGSKIVMEDGIKLNTSRNNKREPKMSLHAVALPGKSIVETIIPNLDQVQITKLKMENAIAVAKPQGLSIEVGSLQNIDLGDGEMAPLELIKLARHTGDVLWRATTHAGGWNNSQRPIDMSPGGVGAMLNEFITIFEMNFNFISELSGIDRLSGASPKSQAETATAAKIATAATSDALKPLFNSYIMLKEWGGQSVLPRIQRAISKHPEAEKAYKNIIGSMGVEIMKFSERLGVANLGIKVEIKPNDQLKADLRAAATESLKPGKDGEKITMADWYFLVSLIEKGRTRQAQAILQYRVEQSREQAIKLQQDNMRLNAENAQKQEEAKARTKMMEIEAKKRADIAVEAAKALFSMETANNQALLALREKLILDSLAGGGAANQQQQAQEVA